MSLFSFIRFLFAESGKSKRYSWKKVSLLILLSCFIVSGGTTACWFFYRYTKTNSAFADEVIQAIVQTSPQTGLHYAPVPSAYFAEVLGLSVDCSVPLGEFDLTQAKQQLLSTGAIRQAKLKKMKPNILFIQYSVRFPIAFLEDFTNTAVDGEGAIFAYAPFFAPRDLPSIYLGEKRPLEPWGSSVPDHLFALVKDLFFRLGEGQVARIDLSQCEAGSAGKKEIVICLKGGGILRLSPKNYRQQLTNYTILKRNFLKNKGQAIIDLRISDIAYIEG